MKYNRFHAVITFTYGPQQGCGGNINVDGSNAQTIQSYDANNDGKYENEMDCHWFIMGDPGQILRLTFTRFNLEAAGNNPSGVQECFDYLEVIKMPKNLNNTRTYDGHQIDVS